MTEAAAPDVSTQSQESQPANDPTSGFSVPEAYSDRGWAKDIKSADDLWKLTDNAQSLIGKRPAGIPTKDAPPEEWDKFYATLGRPDSADKYELSTSIEGLPEDIDLKQYEDKAKSFFHKLGLSNEKANQAWNDYLAMELESVGEMKKNYEANQAELDKKFDDLTNSMFGDKFKDVSAQAQSFLKEALPTELMPVVERLGDDPEALVALIKVAHEAQNRIAEVKKQYGAEDRLSSGGQNAGESLHDVNQKMIAAKERYQKSNVFSQERKDAENEINALREQLKRLAR